VTSLSQFTSHVSRKYQLYNGLFLSLPFPHVRDAGIMLPVFAGFCNERLAAGDPPERIVREFFRERMPDLTTEDRTAYLFLFMQIAERQIVLFDALEDAAFPIVHDLEGPGTLREEVRRVAANGMARDLRELLSRFRVRVVLTAHPTQFYPDEVLGIITDLSEAVARDDTRTIYDLLLQMGKTRFKNQEKPTPLDEARSLLWYLENVFYDTIPSIQRTLSQAVASDEQSAVAVPPVLELGFWPGGDRDGNPFVTADLTLRIGGLLRQAVLRRYRDDLQKLARRLTFPGITEALKAIDERLQRTIWPFSEHSFPEDEEALFCAEVDDSGYHTAAEFLDDLRDVHTMLYAEHEGLFADQVANLINKVDAFGFHFASMDIRQDSRVHAAVIEEIIAALPQPPSGPPFTAREPSERIDLMGELKDALSDHKSLLARLPDGLARDTLLSLRAAAELQSRNGPRGVHRYIISNTRSEADVLAVWFLARAAGMPEGAIPLDIVPLFETIADLHRSTHIMEALYGHPTYAAHLQSRNRRQTIMLGFSDGTKDGGYVTANWEIFKTKRRLTAQAVRHGIDVVFFDGRGGPPARGGGNSHLFYRSFGRTIASSEIQLTIQGQTISSKYGTCDAARFNLEQLVSAGIETNLFPESHAVLTGEEVGLLEELSAAAGRYYQELRANPAFVPYLEQRTPLTFYGRTNIASRPTQRGNDDRLRLDQLRAIPFVGAWSQMKQNVPGYYGFGLGLAELMEARRTAELEALYGKSLFFRTLVGNAMQSLAKTAFDLTAYLDDDPEFGDIWRNIRAEAERTRERLLRISGQSGLLDGEPVTRESIRMREEIVLPVLVIQQYALRALANPEHRAAGESRETLERIITKSLAAGVNASRNAV
jgi:phosphoenolpyruvate carboxylase